MLGWVFSAWLLDDSTGLSNALLEVISAGFGTSCSDRSLKVPETWCTTALVQPDAGSGHLRPRQTCPAAGVIGGVAAALLLGSLAALLGYQRHTGRWPLAAKAAVGSATIAAPEVEPSQGSQPQLPELVPDRSLNTAHMLRLRGGQVWQLGWCPPACPPRPAEPVSSVGPVCMTGIWLTCMMQSSRTLCLGQYLWSMWACGGAAVILDLADASCCDATPLHPLFLA